MSQAPSNTVHSRPNGTVDPDTQRRPEMPENQKVVREDDGSVWRVEFDMKTGEKISSSRVDSIQDVDAIAKGFRPWYLDLLEAQEAAVKAVEKAELKAQVKAELEAEALADAPSAKAETKPAVVASKAAARVATTKGKKA